MSKHQGKQGLTRTIIRHYNKHQQQKPDDCEWLNNPQGPIALLMSDLHSIAATLGDDLVIRRHNEPPIDMWNLPRQHLKKAINAMMAQRRAKVATQDRTHLHGLVDVVQ